MQLKFCGAAREVTGSAHLLTLDDGFTILLDCGLYQGNTREMEGFNERWLFDPQKLDCLVLSHAHIDHIGRVPKLVKDGFEGPIYSTHATQSLCAIMLADSAVIQQRDAEYYNKHHKDRREPLYTTEHAKRAMNQFVTHPYDKWFPIHPQVDVQYRDAGHILGSASVTLRIRRDDGQTVHLGFTGDIGRYARPILRDPQPMPPCDYVICESTYGDREHLEAPAEFDHFLRIIEEACVEKRGKLLIPAFSIGRTQEVVYVLDQLEHAGRLPRVPVYVDSPLAVNATAIFSAHPECYDKDLTAYLLENEDPFGFNHLHYIRKVEASKALNADEGPCIIISATGMMNAGRSKHHLFHIVDNPRHTVLIVGYAAPHTPGGRLREGAETIKMFGQKKPVRARVEIMDSFSAHADRTEMLRFLDGQQAQARKIFLVHGTIDRQEPFRSALLGHGFREVGIPELGDSVEL